MHTFRGSAIPFFIIAPPFSLVYRWNTGKAAVSAAPTPVAAGPRSKLGFALMTAFYANILPSIDEKA